MPLSSDMDVPGYRLHPLKGRMKGRWSIWVSGNWGLTFEFTDGNAHALDYEEKAKKSADLSDVRKVRFKAA
jgi:plasmid maintenance system killer protein